MELGKGLVEVLFMWCSERLPKSIPEEPYIKIYRSNPNTDPVGIFFWDFFLIFICVFSPWLTSLFHHVPHCNKSKLLPYRCTLHDKDYEGTPKEKHKCSRGLFKVIFLQYCLIIMLFFIMQQLDGVIQMGDWWNCILGYGRIPIAIAK